MVAHKKTGSDDRPWVEFTRPRPARVPRDLIFDYWTEPPPELSARCVWWLEQIDAGWRPNQRFTYASWSEKAFIYGVYQWEYQRVISDKLAEVGY